MQRRWALTASGGSHLKAPAGGRWQGGGGLQDLLRCGCHQSQWLAVHHDESRGTMPGLSIMHSAAGLSTCEPEGAGRGLPEFPGGADAVLQASVLWPQMPEQQIEWGSMVYGTQQKSYGTPLSKRGQVEASLCPSYNG